MKKIDINQVETGAILAEPIFNSCGQTILNRGTTLTPNYIERLKRLDFNSLYIMEESTDDATINEIISEKTRQKATAWMKQFLGSRKNLRDMNVPMAKEIISNIVEDINYNQDVMLNLSDSRNCDELTYEHSINVTVLSMMIGKCLHYNRDKLCDLGLGVFLHDIGKMRIPSDILYKPGALNKVEFELIKRHTWFGFEVLRDHPEIKITSAHISLQHHERFDGSGYPRNLKGTGILEYARISAIADVYDAMSTDRCYRKKLPLPEVYKYLLGNAGSHFDHYILDRFIQKIAFYPQGTKVRLNDGRSGFVIKQNNLCPNRPTVRLFWGYDGSQLPRPQEINLIQENNLVISEVIAN